MTSSVAEFLKAQLDAAEEWLDPFAPDSDRRRKEIAAKRRILARHEECGTGAGYCDDGGHCAYDGSEIGCGDLRDLASIDDDHPGYRQEWKP